MQTLFLDELNVISKNWLQILFDDLANGNICTIYGAWDKKSYSESFLEHKEIRLHTKFQTYLTLHSVFLPINPIFKKEIFGLKIFPLLQFFCI